MEVKESIRLTPEIVLEAYQKTGFEPGIGDYFPDCNHADGLGAYVASKLDFSVGDVFEFNRFSYDDKANDYMNENFSHAYIRGFANAFDGEPKATLVPCPTDLYDMGYEDGSKAVAVLKDKSLLKAG